MMLQSPSGRLAFVSHKFQKNDGQGRVNYEIVRAALKSGYHVTVIASSCAAEISLHPNARFICVGNESLPTELLRNLVFAVQSSLSIRKIRRSVDLIQGNGFVTWEPCDIVAAHFIHSAWSRSPYYPFKALRPYAIYQRLYTALNVRWEKSAFRRARHVVSVSKKLVPDLVALGVRPEDITVIFNGVDTQQFSPGPSERQGFGLPMEVPIAVFVGDIKTPRKNLDTVLRALVSTPFLHLAVAGDKKNSPYPALAGDLGLTDRVHFLGRVTRMPELMRSVDLFVFPSRFEAHPLVLLEAMSSGLPCVVSGTFGAEDFLGRSGFILEHPDDEVGLAQYLNRLVSDPKMRAEMGYAGRQQALSMSWARMAFLYLEIYESYIPKTK